MCSRIRIVFFALKRINHPKMLPNQCHLPMKKRLMEVYKQCSPQPWQWTVVIPPDLAPDKLQSSRQTPQLLPFYVPALEHPSVVTTLAPLRHHRDPAIVAPAADIGVAAGVYHPLLAIFAELDHNPPTLHHPKKEMTITTMSFEGRR